MDNANDIKEKNPRDPAKLLIIYKELLNIIALSDCENVCVCMCVCVLAVKFRTISTDKF